MTRHVIGARFAPITFAVVGLFLAVGFGRPSKARRDDDRPQTCERRTRWTTTKLHVRRWVSQTGA
jgi:hypothetical protein